MRHFFKMLDVGLPRDLPILLLGVYQLSVGILIFWFVCVAVFEK